MKTLFNKFMMAIVAVVMVIGFSAFKLVEKSSNIDSFFYELDPSGNIGEQLDEEVANCTQPSGTYCFIELSEEKPENVHTVQDAIDESIMLNVRYWNE